MRNYFRNTLNPDSFHGHGKHPVFFEGWYFKLVDAQAKQSIAVIPGIFLARTPERTQAFIQVFEGANGAVIFVPFPENEFRAKPDKFDIHIGENYFSASQISLKINHPDIQLNGSLTFRNIETWPITLLSPGIMGWYAWAPFMQCYHGVVSLDHEIAGELTLNAETIDFSGGRGYIEKDWGKSFPESWVWLQCNHFGESGISVTASIAIIPWIRGAFPGFIMGFLHRGKLYRFATYTGARIEKFEVFEHSTTIIVRDNHNRLSMEILHSGDAGMLFAPTESGMIRRIPESLNAAVDVCLESIRGSEINTIFEARGRPAGFEFVGDIPKLISMWQANSN